MRAYSSIWRATETLFTFSLVIIFLPVAMMTGIVGRFMSSFGYTAAFAVLGTTYNPGGEGARFIKLRVDPNGDKIVRALKNTELVDNTKPVYLSHWALCPDAKDWSTKNRKTTKGGAT